MHAVSDALKRGLRWLVWHPARLLGAVALIMVVWIVVAQIRAQPDPITSTPEVVTATENLPAGWESWSPLPASSASALPLPTENRPTLAPSPGATPPSPVEAPVWDTTSRQAVIDAALQAVTAYTAGDQAGLDAITGYDLVITVQPADVVIATADPQAPWEASARVTSEHSPLVTQVVVPTSAGDYLIGVQRLDGASPWLIRSITPPDQ